MVGDDDGEVPPVPIPNTVVKLSGAEDTWVVTPWKNRSMPALKKPLNSGFFLLLQQFSGKMTQIVWVGTKLEAIHCNQSFDMVD